MTELERMQAEHQAHLHFLEGMDKVNRAIQGADDLEQMMEDVLDVVLSIFACDRAALVYPCDPLADEWHVPMERSRPEYPSVLQGGKPVPTDPKRSEVVRILLNADGPVRFGAESECSLILDLADKFGIKSHLAMAIYPKIGIPWEFVIHQCSHPRIWTTEEERLFEEIGRRLADALSSLLMFRNLQKSEARFRAVINHAADAFFIHDAEGTVLDVNHQACMNLGYDRDELIGTTPLAFTVDAESELMGIGSRLKAGEVFTFETRHRRKDGTAFPVELRVCQFVQDGKRLGVSLARDITERKQAEQRVRQLNRTYAVLSDINQLIIRELDPRAMLAGACRIAVEKGGFPLAWIGLIDESSGKLKLTEYASSTDGIQNKFSHIFSESMPNCPIVSRALESGSHVICNNIETDPKTKSWRTAAADSGYKSLVSLPLVINGHHAGVFSLYAGEHDFFDDEEMCLLDELALDIAFALENYEREQERRRALEQMRASEERFRELAETIQEVFWVTDPEKNQMLYISPAYEEIWGRSYQSLYDEPHSWLEAIHPDDRERVMEAAMLRQKDGGYDEEYRIIRPDGEERWISDRAFAVYSKTGKVERVVGAAQDITTRRQLEEQFRQSQKMDAIGRLAGGIAHDFNNLLVPIMGYIDINMADIEQNSRLYNDLSQVRNAAERAADLTGQILAFSRQQVLELATLDLNMVVREFKRMLQRLIGEHITLHTSFSPSLHEVKADKGQIEQVLMNLAVNSRDAMPGGGKLSIETADTCLEEAYIEAHGIDLVAGDYVMLAISDTGQGMDAETQKRIFDPFFTTKPEGKGTGLGLSTVFGIVKQHQGHISVSSEPDSGTTFRIYLPRAVETEQANVPKTQDADAIHGTETVLVVEDEEMVRKLVCQTLAVCGYNVLEAPTPSDCLKLAAEAGTVHLLLTDIIMPEMNGKELYEELNAILPNCKVLYMSGYTGDVIVPHGFLEEGVNYLKKPFAVRDLRQKVREVLDTVKEEL